MLGEVEYWEINEYFKLGVGEEVIWLEIVFREDFFGVFYVKNISLEIIDKSDGGSLIKMDVFESYLRSEIYRIW